VANPFQQLRATIYDAVIVDMTAGWYRAVLERLPDGCRLLDVGIGTGAALLANADLVTAKGIRVTGVDIDTAYVQRCEREVRRRGYEATIQARLESVYDHRGGPYDAAYFSGSFMLLPDPAAALRHVAALLEPGSRLFFTQTFERERSRLLEFTKPLLKRVTTIDFGQVTYEEDFRRAVADAGLVLEEFAVLGDGRNRHAALAVARSATAATA
jgi:SAM-dependent methyltransferase